MRFIKAEKPINFLKQRYVMQGDVCIFYTFIKVGRFKSSKISCLNWKRKLLTVYKILPIEKPDEVN